MNEEYLRGLGVGTILGGEFEEGLASLAARLDENEKRPFKAVIPSGARNPSCFESHQTERFLVAPRSE